MRHLAAILTLLFISSCGNKIGNANVKEQNDVEVVNVGIDKDKKKKQFQSTEFYIKDEKQYSETFLAEFKAKHNIYETVALIGDTIIINNDRENIILIPADLPLDQFVTYEESTGGIKHTLIVKRTNLSTLEYNYFETVNGKMKNEKQGQADLEPVFYFGAEGTFEDENKNVYGMNEYINSSKDGCQTVIYIGVGSIEKTFIKQHCKSEIDNFKTSLLQIKK